MDILLNISIILIFGLVIGHLFKVAKLPEVIGYLNAGILIGPYVLDLVTRSSTKNLDLFSVMTLSFVSFLVGAEFKLDYVKKLGRKPFIIGIVCAITTMFIVTASMIIIGKSISFALIIGAIASATAPASIMMVIKESKAKGETTNTLLEVVAISDVISVIAFGFAVAIARYLESGTANLAGFLEPFIEIGASLIIGTILGLLLGFLCKLLKTKNSIICLVLLSIFFAILIADCINISSILMCMVMGVSFVNAYKKMLIKNVLDIMDHISAPLLIIFFVVSGISLDFTVLPSIGLIGITYLLARTSGKIIGSYIGAKIGEDAKESCSLGPALLSQTGIAVGLALTAKEILKQDGEALVAIIIATGFIFDIVGPYFVKLKLTKCGDINGK